MIREPMLWTNGSVGLSAVTATDDRRTETLLAPAAREVNAQIAPQRTRVRDRRKRPSLYDQFLTSRRRDGRSRAATGDLT
jgi:hypothetical protein